MKTINTILKIAAALAVAAGVIYVIATYGDKIVAWAKEMLDKCSCMKCNCCACEAEEEPAEEAEAAAEEPAEEVVIDDGTPVADESDFVG